MVHVNWWARKNNVEEGGRTCDCEGGDVQQVNGIKDKLLQVLLQENEEDQM